MVYCEYCSFFKDRYSIHSTNRYSENSSECAFLLCWFMIVSINIWIIKKLIEYRTGNEKVIYQRGTVPELTAYSLLT